MIAYRRDIDGLRALAVLVIILFHFDKQLVPGGFVGVDVFFVISGFLITGIICSEGKAFSFADFYGRRIRRILPASTFVTGATLIVGSLFLLPADVKALSLSAVYSIFSAANVYFWLFLDTSYFAQSSETVPLLHMWSLGVEEQFYLIWPAVIFAATRIGGLRLLTSVSVFVIALSFGLSEYWVSRDPSFAYYMLPSRAGELMIGSLLALPLVPRRWPLWSANVIGFGGACLVFLALAVLDEKSGFPGFRSLAPAGGTALLIAAGFNQNNIYSRVLSNPVLRVIGLRSFSLYLWHWPIFAFYRYGYGERTYAGFGICFTLLIVLTELTYRWIEIPFRSKSPRWLITKAAPIFIFGGGVVLSACVLVRNNGLWPIASSREYLHRLAYVDFNTKAASKFQYNCQMFKNDTSLWSNDRCVIGDKGMPADVLLWGDSNAAHYVGYMKVIAEHYHFAVRNISHSSCPPVRELSGLVPQSIVQSCSEFNDEAFRESKRYNAVVIGAAWDSYAQVGDRERFAKTIKELASDGNHVVIALNVPIFDELDRMCAAKALRIPWSECRARSEYVSTKESQVNRYLIDLASHYQNVSTFGVRDYVCRGNLCSAYQDGSLLYYDRGHLSMIGSQLIGEEAVKEGRVPAPIIALKQH